MISRISRQAEWCKHAIVWIVLLFAFYPLFIMIVISFKDNHQYQANPWFFDPISQWHWDNWSIAWNIVKNYIANSIAVAVTSVVIGMVMITLTSYVLARYRFPGRNVVYYGIIATMFLPDTAATLVSMFWLIRNLQMVNSLWALILAGTAGGQVAGIFIVRQFIEEIPRELFESAQIDGAGHIRQIISVVLPMSGSILATVAIINFLGVWNEVILPLIVLRDDEKLTIPVGLLRLEGEYIKQWGQMMAGYAIASVPLVLLFVFTMRWFIKGLAAGAIKG